MFKICCASLFLIAITFIKVSACTNFLLTRGATQDGSTMITYSADSHVLYGELYHWPAGTWPAGTMIFMNGIPVNIWVKSRRLPRLTT